MPNRMLKDWTNSDKVDQLTAHGEVFFTRLIMKADDFGCFWADRKRLKANLFPLKSDVRDTDISRWLDECQKVGLITVYNSDDKEYLQIINFGQRLRSKTSKFPTPDSGLPTNVSVLPPELEEKKEEEEKGNVAQSNILYSIEHCVTVALNDDRWTRANKTNKQELQEFNSMLERTGVYEKNPADYKSHFSRWKAKGKKDDPKGGGTKMVM